MRLFPLASLFLLISLPPLASAAGPKVHLPIVDSGAAAAPALPRPPALGNPAALPLQEGAAGAAPAGIRSVDVAIMGSGYGGAVAGRRFTDAGFKTVVLEQGLKGPDFPRGDQALFEPAKGRLGAHMIRELSPSITTWAGAHWGGGSAVNAAIMLRKIAIEGWPGGLSTRELEHYYGIAESMLTPSPYPVHDPRSPYFGTEKTVAILEAARALGQKGVLPNIAVQFARDQAGEGRAFTNKFGERQEGCRQCGECSLPGCNHGAKNSLDKNYLAGLEGLTGRKVDRIEPLPQGGYLITTRDLVTGEEETIRANVLVLSGGAQGSTETLLRNQRVHGTLPNLSPALGTRFTTNGNFIGGVLASGRPLNPGRGPEITAGIEFPGQDGKPQGFHVFDGSYRKPWSIISKLAGMPGLVRDGLDVTLGGLEDLGLIDTQNSLPLLALGRDKAVGRFTLDDEGRLMAVLDPRQNKGYYARVEKAMKAVTKAWGGVFAPFPLWHIQRRIEVPHPLGGVPMGDDPSTGVVDSYGRVYGYDNLMVLDGSIIRESPGVNPALTIAALAERGVEMALDQLRSEGRIRAERP